MTSLFNQLKSECKSRQIVPGKKSSLTLTQLLESNREKEHCYKNWLMLKNRKCLTPVTASNKIVKWWKRYRFANQTDFVTLEIITPPVFCLVEESGHRYRFQPEALYRYFLSEGNFVQPYTRRPLNIIELKRLDKLLAQMNIASRVPLQEKFQEITQRRAAEREHERTCQLLMTECCILVHFIEDSLQQNTLNSSCIRLVQTILPQFFLTFRQLYMLDNHRAFQTLHLLIQQLESMYDNPEITATPEACQFLIITMDALNQGCQMLFPIVIND